MTLLVKSEFSLLVTQVQKDVCCCFKAVLVFTCLSFNFRNLNCSPVSARLHQNSIQVAAFIFVMQLMNTM